ncbi:hypothetical protein HOR54_gp24 [Vibrio phage Vp670]|uniref:Uncharacterized protein n=1 Tax=Vibrio phage Vp670 TaxID=1932890 RepID=A0A1L7DPV9_9CAUD|nr:hypothetical protein HOR54_gp24 [Vibrio phage Vp670]APU00161.1 hypothetical protein QD07_24 [Vibrio phage Vp670]
MFNKDKMTQEELARFYELSSMSYDDVVDLACEGDAMAQVLVSCSSAHFATAHAKAVLFEEIMTQTFRVRIKSVPSYMLDIITDTKIRKDLAQMGGKYFDCKIDWHHSQLMGELHVRVHGGKFPDYHFSYNDLTKLTTVRKMKAMFDYFKTTNEW